MNTYAGLNVRVGPGGGTSVLYINNSANVGIGTTNPTSKLDVNGVITATGGNSSLWNTAYGWGNHASAGYLTSFSETDPEIGANTTNYLAKWNGSALVAGSVFDNGNVGIGTTNPTQMLDVYGNIVIRMSTNSADKYQIQVNRGAINFSSVASDNNHIIYNNALNIDNEGAWDGIKMNTYAGLNVRVGPGGGTSVLYINNSANVGIGTTNPSNKLHIFAATDPLRLEGLQTTAQTDVLVVDANGVISKRAGSFVGASSDWTLFGNAGIVDGTNFIGTTDNVSLNFKVNNEKSGRISAADGCVFLGYQAGRSDDQSNNNNTAIGFQSFITNSTGNNNSAVGFRTLYANTTGNYNSAFGCYALYLNTTGIDNVAVGFATLSSNITGSKNTATGEYALYGNTSANNNTASGYSALFSNTSGHENTAIGTYALTNNVDGAKNTAVGYLALNNNSAGNDNTALGNYSGYGASGQNFTTCTFVGAFSYPTVSRSNVTMLGSGITNGECSSDNQVLLGNTAVTQIRAQVSGITTYSDKRFKENIEDNVVGLDFIMRLKPVSYTENPEKLHKIWGTPDSLLSNIDHSQIKHTKFVGFLAQDVEEAMTLSGWTDFSGIDIPQSNNEVYALRYTDFIMPLVKSVQEQQIMIDKQNNIYTEQQLKIENLTELIREQQIMILQMQKEINSLK